MSLLWNSEKTPYLKAKKSINWKHGPYLKKLILSLLIDVSVREYNFKRTGVRHFSPGCSSSSNRANSAKFSCNRRWRKFHKTIISLAAAPLLWGVCWASVCMDSVGLSVEGMDRRFTPSPFSPFSVLLLARAQDSKSVNRLIAPKDLPNS